MDLTDSQKHDRQAALQRSQNDLFSLEGDLGRLKRKHEEMEIEVRRVESSITRLEADRNQKQVALKSVERDIFLKEEEIKATKRRMDQVS